MASSHSNSTRRVRKSISGEQAVPSSIDTDHCIIFPQEEETRHHAISASGLAINSFVYASEQEGDESEADILKD